MTQKQYEVEFTRENVSTLTLVVEAKTEEEAIKIARNESLSDLFKDNNSSPQNKSIVEYDVSTGGYQIYFNGANEVGQ
jgi:hypothetical protein